MADYSADSDNSRETVVSGSKEEIGSLNLSQVINFDELLKSHDLQTVAAMLTEGALVMSDFMKKDVIDRFLDFIFFKIQTGNVDIPSMVFPTKRMLDSLLEKKIIELINVHLFPEVIFRLLKFFTRNIHDADTNLYVANLIYSEEIIKAIYDAYKLIKKDIFMSDRDKRTLNVKRIQQYSPRSDNKQSSPLDAAARLKYILEFFLIKYNVSHIYTKKDITFSQMEGTDSP
jgi:hypothetical protein